MENSLLKVLAHTLKRWPVDTMDNIPLNNPYVKADIIRQTDGRIIITTRYPEPPEIVTYDMWIEASTRGEMISMFEKSDLYFGNNLEIPDLVDFLIERGYGKITKKQS